MINKIITSDRQIDHELEEALQTYLQCETEYIEVIIEKNKKFLKL